MKILILCPYPPNEAPSQRFRFEQYLNFLKDNGIEIDRQPFLDRSTWKVLYKKDNGWGKIWGIIKGFSRRKLKVFTGLQKYDFVFIHREASPIGPPFLEWWMAKVAKKKIIYDFDDSIWLPNTSEENKVVSALKWHKKVRSICKWSWKVSVGNEYLADFARQFNDNVVVIPTTIDMEYHVHSKKSLRGMSETNDEAIGLDNPEDYNDQIASSSQVPGTPRNDGYITIGWTGTHSTAPYLENIIPAFSTLSEKYTFQFLMISNQEQNFQISNFKFQKWSKESEIADLDQIDIGIMPMPDNEWTRGKCGFKALQYMALGKPVVASPVGVNTEIIQDRENGFLASSKEEWVNKLSLLIENPELRVKLGKAGRKTVEEKYSVEANKHLYLKLFQD